MTICHAECSPPQAPATTLKTFNFLRFCSSSGQGTATLHGMRLAALSAELRVFRIAK